MLRAGSVRLFAPDAIDDAVVVDGRTMLICCAIRDIVTAEKNVQTIAKVIHDGHVSLFRQLSADDIILSDGPFTDAVIRVVDESAAAR